MMSTWFLYAFLTAGIYAVIALLSKVVSGVEIDDPLTLAIYNCIPFYAVYVLVGLVLEWPAIRNSLTGAGGGAVPGAEPAPIAVALGFGIVSTIAYGIYYWGLVNGDVSRFVPALSLETVFVLVLGFLILDEAFPSGVYAGVGLVVFGALFISYDRDAGSFRESLTFSTVGVAVLAAIAFAVFNTGMKVLTDGFGTVEILFWISLGGLASIAAVVPFRGGGVEPNPADLLAGRVRLTKGTKLLLVGGLLNAVGLFTFIRALEHGPVSLATAITKLDVMMVFVGALALSKLAPALLQEQFDPFTLAQKASASMIVLAGSALIQFSY
ncbi:EamA family transporter [Natronococcus sp. A-GB7]|uniref:EamA family transporter n=1 Tax=Natronococcus sp. A-GB7 TaxID=3037649 RepID=UPI00241C59C0|nr:EamA family transporter [Natronococcus sp. A-GB7]MDG5819325.1 EamA family transporter [Natronococcus sp. A-GB7]